MPKILIILICSLILAFFAAFIACYFLAKLTSLPGKKTEAEEDEFNLYGIKYNCVAKNIEVKSKSYSNEETPRDNTTTRIY
ncbi:hypothetical protein SAMN04487760_11151 [Lachnospiraceae bacterium G41]|nr:hypothetical protein SAMN04487760_11151 [Lachnospiraceae bacterium G41]